MNEKTAEDIVRKLASSPVPLADMGGHVGCSFCHVMARIVPNLDGVTYRIDRHAPDCAYGMARAWDEQSKQGSASATPMSIAINKDGVFVGGHCLAGCTHWEIVRDYADGTTEVRLVLLTNKLTVDLSAPGEHPNRIL